MKTPVVSSQSSVVSAPSELAALREIPLARLQVAEWNARKTFDPVALAELTESIREHGLQVPLLVRPLTLSEWRSTADADAVERGEALFEIVAGHRRFKAAWDLQLATVPCIVRELTDDQAREIGIIDNLQREDVPALEEAYGYADLQRRGSTPAQIAQRVGKQVAYVVQRLKLCELTAFTREALAARLISLDHALLLAKVGAEEEEDALRWTLDRFVTVKQKTEDVLARAKEAAAKGHANAGTGKYFQPQGVPALRQWIEEHVDLKLSRAPWDLEDAELLPGAGACTACPKNTQANQSLFGDLAITAASCTDALCWNQKRTAFVQVQLGLVTAAGANPVRLSWKESSAAPRMLKDSADVNPAQTFKQGQWVEAKKGSCPNVVTGVTVDFGEVSRWSNEGAGKKPGKKLAVCVTPKCKAHAKAWEVKDTAPGVGGARQTEEQRAAADRKRDEAHNLENQLRMGWAITAVRKTKKLPELALRRLLLRRLGMHNVADLRTHLLPKIGEWLASSPLNGEEFAQALAALWLAENAMEHFSAYQPADYQREDFLTACKVLGIDARPGWDQPKAEKKLAAKKAVLTPAQRKKIAAEQAKRLVKKGGRK